MQGPLHQAIALLVLAPAPEGAAHADGSHGMLVTMATAMSAGVLLIVVARRLNLPSIVLLLVGGALLGPAIWSDRAPVQPAALGEGLRVIVALGVGLILFEGGLTLDVSGYRSASAMIKRLLTVGVILTWLLIAGAVRFVVGLSTEYAVLSASLVIVTGPTVIAPLLKRVKVTAKLHSILHWEGVLIDPIGVFVALLCFEYVVSGETGLAALGNLGVRIAAGLGLGVIGGAAIALGVKRRLVPDDMASVFALACAVLVFGAAEMIHREAGLLAVTAAGFVFAVSGAHQVKQVREFKAELTDLLVGTLFILLSARLTFGQFRAFGAEGLVVVAIVMLVVRPLSIVICGIGLDLTLREKAFLSWVAPRGIVAASMASLFAISMEARAPAEAAFVESFTYSVIIATIVLQGLSASAAARALGVQRAEACGWLVVGAHLLARQVAKFIAEAGELPVVVVVDTNGRAVREALNEGLTAFVLDARETALLERPEGQAVGNVLALTDNEDLNIRVCQSWTGPCGADHVFRCNPTGADPPEGEAAVATPGAVVWPRLPKPTLVAGELARGEAGVRRETRLGRPAAALLAIVEGRVVFDPDPGGGDEDAPAAVLYLEREADYLRRCLRPELVVDLEVGDVESLFQAMLDRVVAVHPEVARDEVLRELLSLEATFPSALGAGVAAPHAHTRSIDRRVCVIARIPGGVDFGAHDGVAVRLVFLLVGPLDDPEGHLATLAEIARLVANEAAREALVAAPSPQHVLEIVRRTSR